MVLDQTVLVFVYGITTMIFVLLAIYVWRRRAAPGSYYFALLMAAGAFWAFGTMLQMSIADIPLQILISKLTYLGIVSAPVLWVMFSIAYGQRSRQLDAKLWLLWVVPIIIVLLVFTNDWHHLFWTAITPVAGGSGSMLVRSYGPGMWLCIAYSYSLMIAGTIMIAHTSMRTYRHYFMQTFLLVVGTFIPYIGNILYFLWLSKYTAFDPTPISFAIAGLLYAWSMFRYGLFDIVPMARERLISEMADGIMVLDDRGRVIDMNRSAREMLGLEGGFGQPLETMLAAWPELSRFCQEAPGEAAEIRVDRPAGGLWLNVDISPLHDKNGAVTGKLVMLRNITKRKMAENALEESRASFKTMFDAANDLLYIIDHQGRFLEVNNAVIAQLGYTREELIGSSPLRLMSAYDDCVVKEYPPLRPMRYPITLRAKDGKQLMVETHVVPGLWLGQPAVFGIARDMTEHMRQQEALRESNLALSAEVEERRRAEEKIASSLLEKEVMLKEIHHRVKNNMQIIISMLNLQKPSVVDARDQEIFLDCMSRIKSMALVHEKLYQSGDLGDIDFEDYIRSFVSYLFNAYVSDPAKVRLSVNVTKARWNIDKAVVLGLILNEIISNSIKYAFPDGREGNVFVNLGQGPDDTYVLEVGDTGVGIPEDTLKKNNSTLGLRLIKILAGQIDSELAIETAGGTRFRFSFRSDSNG